MITRRILAAVLVLCVFLAPTARAEQEPRVAQDQTTMNRQAEDDYRKADAELNRVYKKVVAELNAPIRKKLVNAQLLWIKYRDAEAKAYAAQVEGGSMYPLLYFGSLTSSTMARTKQLKDWLISGPAQ